MHSHSHTVSLEGSSWNIFDIFGKRVYHQWKQVALKEGLTRMVVDTIFLYSKKPSALMWSNYRDRT